MKAVSPNTLTGKPYLGHTAEHVRTPLAGSVVSHTLTHNPYFPISYLRYQTHVRSP